MLHKNIMELLKNCVINEKINFNLYTSCYIKKKSSLNSAGTVYNECDDC